MKYRLFACATLTVFSLLIDARSVHVDIFGNGDVVVDVDADEKKSSPIELKSSSSSAADDYIVDLYYEKHKGALSASGAYVEFKNIPYAQPPIGDLRFFPPQYIYDSSDKVNNGSKNNICPQYDIGWAPAAKDFVQDMLINPVLPDKWTTPIAVEDYEKWQAKPPLDPRSSEDCLLLDVHVPLDVWKKRNQPAIFKAASIVWIHGGGFINGWKDQVGSPESLLNVTQLDNTPDFNDGMIYIAINYRLGAFGFLGGEAFYDESGVLNMGLLDQKAALDWVKQYISIFGGDPTRITAMGQSAGASSIMHHITAYGGSPYPNYRPAFSKAIIVSPGFFPRPNLTVDNLQYEKFLQVAGVKNFSELLTADSQKLMQANADMTFNSSYGIFEFGPTVDYNFVPDLPGKLLKRGQFHAGIPLLIGHEKFDGVVFTPPWIRSNDALNQHVQKLFPDVNQTVLDFITKTYPIEKISYAKEKLLKVSDFLDDVSIQCNTHYLSEATLSKDPPYGTAKVVYRFVFNVVPAIHGRDVAYTFYPNIDSKPKVNSTLATFWQRSIVNFARYFTPDEEGDIVWPQYTTDNRTVMNLGKPSQWLVPDNTNTTGPDVLDRDICAYWQDAPYYYQPPRRRLGGVGLVDQTEPHESL